MMALVPKGVVAREAMPSWEVLNNSIHLCNIILQTAPTKGATSTGGSRVASNHTG